MSGPYAVALLRKLGHRATPAPGFTLIELLTVIAIIGILAAILIPVAGRVRRAASSAQCSSNMRQVGTALQLYSEDYRGYLPCPGSGADDFHTGQGPWFNVEPHRLQNHLRAYSGAPKATSWAYDWLFDPNFAWPAFVAAAQPGSPSVILNKAVVFRQSATTGSPFRRGANGRGRKLDEIENRSTQRVLIEVDQRNSSPTAWGGALPPEPVHGSIRNALYYDWHVAKVPVN